MQCAGLRNVQNATLLTWRETGSHEGRGDFGGHEKNGVGKKGVRVNRGDYLLLHGEKNQYHGITTRFII